MTISIIIPSFNDNQALSELLALIKSWEHQPQEIIVVDALADKNCEAICSQYDARWLSFKKNRGAQQKFGAAHASGDVLWFLHADAKPHTDALLYINEVTDEGSMGGFFKFQFNANKLSLLQKILTILTNCRSRFFVAYGDQGIFVRKDFYEQSGGHADQSLFEEVQLIKALRKSGRLSISHLPIGVSTRRWDKDGYVRRAAHNRLLAIAYTFGIPVQKLSKWYTSKKVQLPDS